MKDWQKKILISLLAALIFVVVSLPWTYELTNKIFGKWMRTMDSHGCPTTFGLAIHTIVFFLITLGTMYIPWDKMKA